MTNSKNTILGVMLAVLLAAPATTLSANDNMGGYDRPADWPLTKHRGRIAGKQIDYVAQTGRIAIRDVETGEPRGYMTFVAYRVPSQTPRPVIFVWNGGPAAESSLLHFHTAGPRRVEGVSLVDNDDSWLSAADIVMVDPIGTGFSFYSTSGDVASVTEFVRA